MTARTDDVGRFFTLSARPVSGLIALDGDVTWGELLRAAAAVRSALGTGRGRRFVLACQDRFHVAAALIATWTTGGVAVLPPNLKPSTVREVAADAGAAAILDDDGAVGQSLPELIRRAKRTTPPRLRLSHDDVLVTLYTSGSTGKAVACHKTTSQLLGEAAFLARAFRLGPRARVLATAPPHHLYGLLFGVLAPIVGGGAFARVTSCLPEAIKAAASRTRANVCCLVPAHLAGFDALADGELPLVRRVFSSGGRLDASVLGALRGRFSFRLVEIFGSTETGGIASREPFGGETWRPFAGVEVTADAEGRMHVASPFLAPSTTVPLACADRIELTARRGFRHLGRTDDVVKIGGERISVVEVEQRLRAVPGVEDAAVVSVASSGARQWELWAAVVAPRVDVGLLRRALDERLTSAARPRRLEIVARLPREASGKLPREQLLRVFDRAGAST